MSEYTAKRNRNRCPTHPGELLRDEILPAIGMGKSEVAQALAQFGVTLVSASPVCNRMTNSFSVRLSALRITGTSTPSSTSTSPIFKLR